MNRPNIQIDNEIREMTDEEYEQWLANVAVLEAENALAD
jgi:hypothetical protein